MKNPKSIRALFAFPGFNASSKLVGKFGDRYARVIQLKRRKKQPSVVTVVSAAAGVTTRRCCGYETCRLKHWTCVELWSGKLRRLNLQAQDLQRVEPGADQFTLRRTRVITATR